MSDNQTNNDMTLNDKNKQDSSLKVYGSAVIFFPYRWVFFYWCKDLYICRHTFRNTKPTDLTLRF